MKKTLALLFIMPIILYGQSDREGELKKAKELFYHGKYKEAQLIVDEIREGNIRDSTYYGAIMESTNLLFAQSRCDWDAEINNQKELCIGFPNYKGHFLSKIGRLTMFKSGDYDQTKEILLQAIALDTSYDKRNLNMAFYLLPLYAAYSGHYQEAIHYFNLYSPKRLTKDQMGDFPLVIAYYRLGIYDSAKKYIDSEIVKVYDSDNKLEIYYYTAMIYHKLGNDSIASNYIDLASNTIGKFGDVDIFYMQKDSGRKSKKRYMHSWIYKKNAAMKLDIERTKHSWSMK